jgi:flagellar basal body-associated protein FliL
MAKNKGLLIMGGALPVLVAGGYLAVRMMLPDASKDSTVAAEKPQIGEFSMAENIMVHPAGTKGARFLRVSAAPEVMNGATMSALGRRDVQIRDIMITELSAHSIGELMEPESKEKIRQTIITADQPPADGGEPVQPLRPRRHRPVRARRAR